MQISMEHCSHQHWQSLRAIQSFQVLENCIRVLAIGCEEPRGTVLIVFSPYELYDADALLSTASVTGEQWQELLTSAPPLQWKTLV